MAREIKRIYYYRAEMCEIFSRSRSWVLTQNKLDPEFPKAVVVGSCLAWKVEDVERYISTRKPREPDGLNARESRLAGRAGA
jgi:predicted DNA-binding transcriptional regulator AlpA